MKPTKPIHAIFGTYTLLLVISIVLATCSSSCFLHRHKQSQSAKSDTAATHKETEISTWYIDTTSTTTRKDETESTIEVEFDSSGGWITPDSTFIRLRPDDYFLPVTGRVKKLVLKTKSAAFTFDSTSKKAGATTQHATNDSASGHQENKSTSQSITRFNATPWLLLLLLIIVLYIAYRNRQGIMFWMLRNGWFP